MVMDTFWIASEQHQMCKQNLHKYVSGTDLYPHMPILRQHAARFHERRISSVMFMPAHLYVCLYAGGRNPHARQF